MRIGSFIFLGIAALGAYYFLKTDNSTIARVRETAREAVPRSFERTIGAVKESIDDTYTAYCRLELEEKIRAYEQRNRPK